MKTMEDVNELLKNYPRTTVHGAESYPYGIEVDESYPENEVYNGMYDCLKKLIEKLEAEGKNIAVRTEPELIRRSSPNTDGSYKKYGYFRLATI